MSRYGGGVGNPNGAPKRVSFPNSYIYEANSGSSNNGASTSEQLASNSSGTYGQNNGYNPQNEPFINASDTYRQEAQRSPATDNSNGKSDAADISDRRVDARPYQPVYQSQQQRQNLTEPAYSTAYQPPTSANPQNQKNMPVTTPQQGPNAANPAPSYGTNATAASQNLNSSTSAAYTALSSSAAPNYQMPNPASNYQTNSPAYQQNSQTPPNQSAPAYQTPSPNPNQFQPNYQSKPQQPTPVKREPSSVTMNPPPSRNPQYPTATTAPLQRQTSSINTAQRPYQPPAQAGRPAVPSTPQKTAPTPRSAPYTPATQNYQTYPSNTVTRQPSQAALSRPAAQRSPTTSSTNLYSSPSNYSTAGSRSSGNYSPDSGRWAGESSPGRPTSARPYTPNYTIDEDEDNNMSSAYNENVSEASEAEEKASLQAKFKTLLRQKVQEPSIAQMPHVRPTSSINPVQSPVTDVDKTLARTNSKAKISMPLTMQGTGLLDEIIAPEKKLSGLPIESPAIDDEDLLNDSKLNEINDSDGEELDENATQVTKTIKFFERNDKAKVPLTPIKVKAEKKEKPVRPTHIDIVSSHGAGADNGEDDESGVDESPVKHPNLRSISNPPRKVARINSGSCSSRPPWVNPRASYPGTPTRTVSAPSRSTPNTPKKAKPPLRFKADDELIDYYRGSEYDHHNATKENRPTTNGVGTPKKTPSRLPTTSRKTPTSTPLKSPSTAMSLPKTPESPAPVTPLIKKVPMNKIQVGAAPSPNIRAVKSKIGSLANTTHKPGGGNVKIENHKLNITAQPRIANKNDAYAPSGGDKKIQHVKLQWNAKSKVGSLENASYKPGGGEKKIESMKLDFKEKAKPKVGSKENAQHVPGGGDVKITHQKLDFKAQSKIGSLDNVKHKPGGGDIKIFEDKSYMKQIASTSGSGTQANNCELSVMSEVRAVKSSGEDDTDISIKRTTTIAPTELNISKTTHVTVVTRSPSKERKSSLGKSPSTHEVKLTYSAVSSPAHAQRPSRPVQVVRVPAQEHAPILNPSVGDVDAADKKPPLPSVLSSSRDRNVTVEEPTKTEAANDHRNGAPISGPTVVKETIKVEKVTTREETKARKEEEPIRVPADILKKDKFKESPINKLLKNEEATHEKVGEIWKEVQNSEFPATESAEKHSAYPSKAINQNESVSRSQSINVNQSNIQGQAIRGPQTQQFNPQQAQHNLPAAPQQLHPQQAQHNFPPTPQQSAPSQQQVRPFQPDQQQQSVMQSAQSRAVSQPFTQPVRPQAPGYQQMPAQRAQPQQPIAPKIDHTSFPMQSANVKQAVNESAKGAPVTSIRQELPSYTQPFTSGGYK